MLASVVYKLSLYRAALLTALLVFSFTLQPDSASARCGRERKPEKIIAIGGQLSRISQVRVEDQVVSCRDRQGAIDAGKIKQDQSGANRFYPYFELLAEVESLAARQGWDCQCLSYQYKQAKKKRDQRLAASNKRKLKQQQAKLAALEQEVESMRQFVDKAQAACEGN